MTETTHTATETPSLRERLESLTPFGWKPKTRPVYDQRLQSQACLAVPFITANAARQRLDEVFGPLGWRATARLEREYQHQPKGAKEPLYVAIIETTIEVFHPDPTFPADDRWIPRCDVGFGRGESIEDALKAAHSDSFKRAALNFGIGRFLDSIPRTMRKCYTTQNNGFAGWVEEAPPPPNTPQAPAVPTGPYWESVMVKFPPFTPADFEPWLGPRADWTKETHGEKFRRLYALIFTRTGEPMTLQDAFERIEIEMNEPHYETTED